MGGRGSSGRGAGTGGGFKLPTLSGSEKQVSWAKDILTHPYDIMGSWAKSFERQADAFDKGGKGYGDEERQTADAYKAAQKRYAQEVKSLGKMFPSGMKASQIIDMKPRINDMANYIIKDEYKKRKINPLNAQKV